MKLIDDPENRLGIIFSANVRIEMTTISLEFCRGSPIIKRDNKKNAGRNGLFDNPDITTIYRLIAKRPMADITTGIECNNSGLLGDFPFAMDRIMNPKRTNRRVIIMKISDMSETNM